jgi:hypothetical protein
VGKLANKESNRDKELKKITKKFTFVLEIETKIG